MGSIPIRATIVQVPSAEAVDHLSDVPSWPAKREIPVAPQISVSLIARVSLDVSDGRLFDYEIPPDLVLGLSVGGRVKVPLNSRVASGVVTEILARESDRKLRQILELESGGALICPPVLEIARWIAAYYCCSFDQALRTVLPQPVRRGGARHRSRLTVVLSDSASIPTALTPLQRRVVSILEEWKQLSVVELVRLANTTAALIRRMAVSGIIRIFDQRIERDPHAADTLVASSQLTLNAEQTVALKPILESLSGKSPSVSEPPFSSQDSPPTKGEAQPIFLLHGVTGSGKTEIYLQAIAGTLQRGRGAMVLVPEISLTPQTVERFRSRFAATGDPQIVAVLHSHLSDGERHDEWHKIRDGRARIVVGARSAVFAPVANLGLIVVDEEHEHSYKQEETPRYHARDVAVVRGQIERAVVVLGTATPSLESYSNALKGKYRLLKLHRRATEIRMPVVRIVDMRSEQRAAKKGGSVISVPLREAIAQRLERREQTILFLNRRGYSTSLLCERCGHVADCPNCSVALTYHRGTSRLLCHICGHEEPVPDRCPEPRCGNPAIRYSGLGTEKVQEVLSHLFPKASVRRMDSDTLKRKDDFRHILQDFRTGQFDILLGTQMIAKGLDFPNVTLVGIIHADLSLHVPDFRAGERTFQLLTQVSGRAGRGDIEGEVFVQTFTPFHPAIQFARRHDFTGFYEQEIEFRRQLNYPPFARIALLTLKGRNEDKVKFCADHLRTELEKRVAGWKDLVLAGPAPAPLLRAETFYRHQLMVRTRLMTKFSALLGELKASLRLPEGVSLTVDIDPVNLM
jgi:primosomal protein N' (replication factor Y)